MSHPEENKCETIFSEHDVSTFQMVEAYSDDLQEEHVSTNATPDMSVGWYASETPAKDHRPNDEL